MVKVLAIIFGGLWLLYNVADLSYRFGRRSAEKDLMKKWYKDGYDDGFTDGRNEGEENGRKYYNIATEIYDHNSRILRSIMMRMEENGDWS